MSKEVNEEERTPHTVADVKEMLVKHSNGEIQRTIQNCITILQNDHVLADAIRLNLLSERIDIVKPVGWPRSGKTLNDTDMKYILRRMEKYGISSEKKIESAIRIVANENRYHPIRDYLNSLQWDGTERIAHVLHHFLGAAEDEYTCEAMKIFLLGAIKRVFQPGCKFETMLFWWAVRVPESQPSSGCWRSRTSGSRTTCGGWTMTTCTASCKVTGSSKCRR